MCPLRPILIFLSATFAGILLVKSFKTKRDIRNSDNPLLDSREDEKSRSVSSKVFCSIASGFWTCIDMASGRYLWRNLSSLSSSKQQ